MDSLQKSLTSFPHSSFTCPAAARLRSGLRPPPWRAPAIHMCLRERDDRSYARPRRSEQLRIAGEHATFSLHRRGIRSACLPFRQGSFRFPARQSHNSPAGFRRVPSKIRNVLPVMCQEPSGQNTPSTGQKNRGRRGPRCPARRPARPYGAFTSSLLLPYRLAHSLELRRIPPVPSMRSAVRRWKGTSPMPITRDWLFFVPMGLAVAFLLWVLWKFSREMKD